MSAGSDESNGEPGLPPSGFGLLTDKVPEDGRLQHQSAGRGERRLLPVMRAHVHPRVQSTPERGDVRGGGRGVRRRPATRSWRAGRVAQAAAAAAGASWRQACVGEDGAPGGGGGGAGILH